MRITSFKTLLQRAIDALARRRSGNNTSAQKRRGRRGERLAARYLERHGYVIWRVNWRVRQGELDIIALDRNTLVFIEVKTRSPRSARIVSPVEAVDDDKCLRLSRTAHHFIRRYEPQIRRRRLRRLRFDIIAITLPSYPWHHPAIVHLQNTVPQLEAELCPFWKGRRGFRRGILVPGAPS